MCKFCNISIAEDKPDDYIHVKEKNERLKMGKRNIGYYNVRMTLEHVSEEKSHAIGIYTEIATADTIFMENDMLVHIRYCPFCGRELTTQNNDK